MNSKMVQGTSVYRSIQPYILSGTRSQLQFYICQHLESNLGLPAWMESAFLCGPTDHMITDMARQSCRFLRFLFSTGYFAWFA